MIYEYVCASEHRTERIRKIAERHDPLPCDTCQGETHLIISKTHRQPDGIYSYCPNVGSEQAFERKRDAIREGKKTIPKTGS